MSFIYVQIRYFLYFLFGKLALHTNIQFEVVYIVFEMQYLLIQPPREILSNKQKLQSNKLGWSIEK